MQGLQAGRKYELDSMLCEETRYSTWRHAPANLPSSAAGAHASPEMLPRGPCTHTCFVFVA